MRMRGRGLSRVLGSTTSRPSTNYQTGQDRTTPDVIDVSSNGVEPAGGFGLKRADSGSGGSLESGKVGLKRADSRSGAAPERRPGLAARRKGVSEPIANVPTSKEASSTITATKDINKASNRKKHPVPSPLKLPSNKTAPIAAPETASSAPTTPWQLPSSLQEQLPSKFLNNSELAGMPSKLTKFPYNNELVNLPNKLPKLFKTQQPSTPTGANCPEDVFSKKDEEGQSFVPVGSQLEGKEVPTKESLSAAIPHSPSEGADLSSLKGIIQVKSLTPIVSFNDKAHARCALNMMSTWS